MLLAFLRGLLKPNYLNGVRAVQAESLVLAALDRELAAQGGMELLQLESAYASLLKDPGQYRNSTRMQADRLQRLREGDPEDPRKAALDLAKTYESLDRSGYLKQIAERDIDLPERLMHKEKVLRTTPPTR